MGPPPIPPGPPSLDGDLGMSLLDLPDPDADLPTPAWPRDLPAARESIPFSNLPAAKVPADPYGNLPAARGATMMFDPAAGLPSNLPAAKGPPALSNLPASKGPPPRPDLAGSRGANPAADLPMSREGFAPGNLPGSRESIPIAAGLPISRDESPKPSDLPAARTSIPIPGASPVRLGRIFPASRTPEPMPVETPSSRGSPLEPLDLGLDLEAGLDIDAPPLARGETIFGNPPSPPVPMGGLFDLQPDLGSMGPGDSELGFTLNIEGADAMAGDPSGTVRAQSALPAIEISTAGVLEDSLPHLMPYQQAVRDAVEKPVAARSKKPVLALAGGGLVAVAAAVYFLVLAPSGPPIPEGDTIAGQRGALTRDLYSAYDIGAKALLAAAALPRPDANDLRAEAAELLLLARIGRSGSEQLEKSAEAALAGIIAAEQPGPNERRARALLEIAKGRGQRVAALLSGIENDPRVELIVGMRHLQSGDSIKAAQTFQSVLRKTPDRALANYLAGRAFEKIGEKDKATEQYNQTVKANPDHLGAQLGLLRLAAMPPAALREKAAELIKKRADLSSAEERAAVLVFSGLAAREQGRTNEAFHEFSQALSVDPKNAAANIALGMAYLREGKFNEALVRLQAIGPALQTVSEGRFALGGATVATHRRVDGLAMIEAAAKQWPRDPRGPFFRGLAAEIDPTPNLDEAARQYQAAIDLDKTFVDASLRLASILQRRNQASEALKVLKNAEDAGAPPTLLQLAWGQALILAKQPQRAEDVFRTAIAGDDKLVTARIGLAEALREQGRVGEAKVELEEALTATPDADGLREKLGEISLALGEKEEAMRHYQSAIDGGKAALTVHVALARVAMDLGKLDVAEKLLTKLSDDAPGTPGALFAMGALREIQGNLGLALQEYRRAVQVENTPIVQLAFGKALLKGGREDDALSALRRAETLAEARLELGRIMFRRQDIERAITDLTTAVNIDPTLDEAYLLIGNAHDHMGDTNKAADAWLACIRTSPTNVEALYRMGRLKADQGKTADAIDFLRRASANVPESKAWAADVYFQLGYAELNVGSRSSARVALEKYLALAPADSPARPAIEKLLQERLR